MLLTINLRQQVLKNKHSAGDNSDLVGYAA